MKIGQSNLRNVITLNQDSAAYTYSHYDQADTENGINLTDNLINRYEGCNKVINNYHYQPELHIQYVGSKHGQKVSRSGGEGNTYQNQKHYGENTHYLTHSVTQIDSCQLGHAGSLVAHGHHSNHVVMDCST